MEELIIPSHFRDGKDVVLLTDVVVKVEVMSSHKVVG
jgi:hypothetical protein